MNLSSGPIKRPILTLMVYLIVITVGFVSFTRLAIDLMPEITWPTISIISEYGNVGPREMEELVTRPIEEAVAAVQGVEEINSTSTEGRSTVRLSFTWGKDLEVALDDVRERIDRVLGRLPEEMERPAIRKFDLSAFPVLIMGVTSELDPLDLRDIIDNQIKYRLERIPGVAALEIWGGLTREVHVNLYADRIKALSLAPSEVINALRRENRNIPAGVYDQGNLELLVRTQGEFTTLDEIRETVITVRDGSPVKVRDIAQVEDKWEEVRQLIRVNQTPSVRVAVRKQSGANTVEVVEEVKREIERIHRDIPHVELVPIIDTSKYIRDSINNVARATLLGGLLAVLVLFVFLRNVASTLMIATAIPVSLLATFGLMYFGGFTLNLMTFGGLALGIGMMVDSSIVVLENIYRHFEQGRSARDAAMEGTREVSSAIIAATLTTLVVFLPVVFMRGYSGILFSQLAYVVSFSLLCSLIIALTLVPMLAAQVLAWRGASRTPKTTWVRKLYHTSETTLANLEDGYERVLGRSMNRKKWILGGSLVLFIISVLLVRAVGVNFMPATDEGEVRVSLEGAVGTRLELMDQATQNVERIVKENVPELESMLARVGGGGWRQAGGHEAQVRVKLVPLAQRNRSSEEVAADLRARLEDLPGMRVRVRASGGLWLLRIGSGGEDNVTVEVRGHDLDVARALGERVQEAMRNVDGITDVRISREEGRPERVIRVNREKAADLGLSVTRIGETLETAVGGTPAGYYREGGDEYRILVRLMEKDRQALDNLLDLTVPNARGEQIVLRNVVEASPYEGPIRIERKDQERTVYVYGNVAGRDMGSVIDDLRGEFRKIPVPREFALTFGGDYEEQQEAFDELMLGIVLALLLVYMVMAGQFESLRHPLVVLFSVPMALIGITVTMVLSGTPFSVNAFIGVIMLAGIIVNNAILLVDTANLQRREQGMELLEAIGSAGKRRLRPILMTTLTTVLGLLPLSFGLGEGGETQAPLARVVIGGLLSSTLITLVLIPVVYVLSERVKTIRN
ncbi:MMPL family transporter [bacterium]|nr:MMPL family transporter [bacterium]